MNTVLTYVPLDGPFNQVDHPVICIGQAIISFYMFRLFFALRTAPAPLPQLIGAVAFGTLANLAARVGHAGWFWWTDIVQFVTWAGAAVAAVRLVNHQREEEASQPDTAPVRVDYFARWENKLTWGFGLIVAAVLVYSYVDVYTQRQKDNAEAVAAAKQAEAKATNTFTQKLRQTDAKQDTLLAAVTSISALQGTIIANQARNTTLLQQSNQDVKKVVKSTTKEVKKTLQSSVIQARPIEPRKPDEPKPDPNLWKRFKGWFNASRMPSDTLIFAASDTLTIDY
ncbi:MULTISPECIES: hypothetical protein [unclassified Spirosoma]|uniref:hypothetical protein n=1 Tax=unclassified Spirosoma TaxID=2621999 RepID=UPI000963F1FE|nr:MULTISPECIES: hypothetical protein [unclassified Spirosoma]MBN8826457.1 hypothetical protein [Spirosoma sp.]OJW76450.1 MAG: hypothetical protein BGO59_23335 [Spirosoma sp. 48-14]